MKHIVYLNNYMLEDIIKLRNNKEVFSQAANNKILGIKKSLEENGCDVKILSTGLVNNNSFKFYKKYNSKIDSKVTYCSIIDIKLLNTIWSIFSTYFEINKINKIQKIDNIIFYNYKPEVAWSAWLANKILKIPLTVEYEDGYYSTEGISPFKQKLFTVTESIVSKNIHSAILVTSKLKQRVNVKNVVVRGIVDEKFMDYCRYKNIKEENNRIKVLYSGGIDKERGIEVLLKSLDYIDEDFELIITGRGPLENKVLKKNDKRISFLGFIEYKKVKENIKNADILINCQLENHNFGNVSFPSKIFEYMATRNLVISSCVSDIKEFGKECFLFYENDNPVQLAKCIEEAIENIRNKNDDKITNMMDLSKNNICKVIGKDIINILN